MQLRASKQDFWARLEKEANNDLHLLKEVGPAFFSGEHLMQLRHEMRQQIRLFDKRSHLAMMLGASGAGWVMLAILGRFFQMDWLCGIAYAACVLCFGGYAYLLFRLKQQFESRGELEFTLRQIEDELRKRAATAPFRSRDAL